MINQRQIEVFHAVYQSGSVSGAARVLGITQPSISKALKRAEDLMGYPLFRVVRGRIVPTDEAHFLFGEAREVQQRIETFNEKAKNLRRGDDGHLRLTALHSLGLAAIPSGIARFRRRHPDISFDIKTVHSEDIVRALYDRTCDIAFAYDAPPPARLETIKLGSGELVLLFRKEDLPGAPRRVPLSMLADRPLIHLVNAGSVGALFNASVGRYAPGSAEINVQSYFVAAGLVREGVGVAVIDEYTARGMLTPDLDYRPFSERIRFDVFGIHLEDRPLSQLGKQFLAVLRELLSEPAIASGHR